MEDAPIEWRWYHTVLLFTTRITISIFDCCNAEYGNWKIGLLLLSIMFLGFSQGGLEVIINVIFMDLFELSATMSGVCSLSIFFGEFIASILLMRYSHKLNHFVSAAIGIISRNISAVLFVIIIVTYKSEYSNVDDVSQYFVSLYYILACLFFWYFGWEFFYVTQYVASMKIMNIKDNVPENDAKKRMVFLNIQVTNIFGRAFGIIVSPILWDHLDYGTNILYISLFVWLIPTVCAALCYTTLYYLAAS